MDMEICGTCNCEHGDNNNIICEGSIFSKVRTFLQKPVVIKITLVWCGAVVVLIYGFIVADILKAVMG